MRAKFKVDSIEHTTSGATVKMTPVVDGSEENKRFYKWTPAGGLTLSTVNPDAAQQFAPGKEFYLDFTPVQPAAA